ncbi:ChrR family anti-sigma-E factor [Variovorax paradoxus]|uniref:ChrR family anti-sigma-E factor n=1 Tax=Variovorax paradoxus TaxID=34073 RepID=UPI001932403F|nr:cupin domain-containing protein [Variovorax paradoxus]
MTIHHHPGDDLLLAFAAGTLAAGPSLVMATHLEACAQCRARVGLLECAGGVLLEQLEPGLLSPQALANTLAAIDAPPRKVPARRPAPALPALPAGMVWPRALEACSATGWRFLAPGMRWSRLRLPSDPGARLFLLRIAEGRGLPVHSHSGSEWTQILHGAFDDGREVFGAGDFDVADGSVHHQPTVQGGGECICLAAVEGSMRFDSPIARAMAGLIGM